MFQAKSDLASHSDSIETSLVNLNIEKSTQQQEKFIRKSLPDKVTSITEQQKLIGKLENENLRQGMYKNIFFQYRYTF